jgi:hypothetical protein
MDKSKAQKERDRRTCVLCGKQFRTIQHLLAHQVFAHRTRRTGKPS